MKKSRKAHFQRLFPSAFLSFFSIFFLVTSGLSPVSTYAATSLQESWQQEREHPTQPSWKTLTTLRQKQVVLVPGIMNEVAYWIAGYFASATHTLNQTFGSTPAYVALPSRRSIVENSEQLYEQVMAIYRRRPMAPMILIGHSKGAAEIFLMLLKHPELIEHNRIENVVLIQAALGGSPLAPEHAEDQGFIASTAMYFLRDGLKCLTPQIAQQTLASAWIEFQNTVPQYTRDSVSRKIHYVRSYEIDELSTGVSLIQWGSVRELPIQPSHANFVEPFDDEAQATLSDGILRLRDQRHPAFGQDIGIVKADHMDLVLDGWVSKKSNSDREAFFRALFRTLYDPRE